MAPGAKRKRGGGDGPDGSGRPSPHRPENLGLANPSRGGHGQVNPQSPTHHRGRAGGGRGGRHSHSARTNTPQASQSASVQNASSSTLSNANQASPAPANHISEPPVHHVSDAPASSQTAPPASVAFRAPPQAPPRPPLPYHYQIITDERVSSWKGNGRSAVLELATQVCKGQDYDRICELFQELLRAGFDARVDPVDAGKLVSESIAASGSLDSVDQAEPLNLSEMFLDTLSIMTESDSANPRIKPLVLATGIPASLMREILEPPLLQNLGLIRPTFDRMFIRKQTNILYKQSNYNLLREETEGYSKLVTELFTTSNNEPPTAEVVEDTFENIKALIGAFDLDAGRVLDVILDLFATLLVKQYRFFVKLLRASSWWPQDQSYGIFTQSQGFNSLPSWAQPNHSHWQSSEDEKTRLAALKDQRDSQFWDRARQVGMDAFFELGGRTIATQEAVAQLDDKDISKNSANARDEETREWIKATKTIPPPGNSVAAQLLGFKLRFYASNARDAHDSLPVNLIYLAALLIKIGFISLRDLYPHLFPEDDALKGTKDKLLTERDEREAAKRPGGGGTNALAKAGALSDDTLPSQQVTRLREPTARATTPSRTDGAVGTTKSETSTSKPDAEDDKDHLPEPADQKVQLLRSLLCIGAIPEALYLLGRFSWLPDAFPDLPDYIHRILHHSLDKIYEPLRPLPDCDSIRAPAPIPATDQGGMPKGELRLQEPLAPKILRWAQLDKMDLSEGVEYRFYWDDWSDNVPVCQNVDDVFTLCNTLLNYSGVKIGHDPTLLVKLVRIGKYSLSEDRSEINKSRWFDLCKRLLVPALSLTKTNPGVVNEVYDLLKQYPTPSRFALYNEWFLGATSRLTDIRHAFDLAKAQTRDTMRRMTKENQRLMARALAKIACASPGVVFQVIFNQIESYSNMIDVVVECGRYFTDMGYDVLTWTLLSSLGRAGRSRVSQKNGINVSQWLSSLSQFAGKLCRRYSVVRTLPILQYVLQQLRLGNFADLQILKELVMNMAGIIPDTDFTDAQVQAMAGGELLQGQILRQVQDRRHESKTPGKRLIKTIVDHDLTGSLLVAIAQQRQMCVFNDNLTQVKAMSENYDNVHIVLTQYSDLLRHSLPVKEFDALVPDLRYLISEFGVEYSVAFMIHRKSIAQAIDEYDVANPVPKKRSSDNPRSKEETDAIDIVKKIDADVSKDNEDVEMAENDTSTTEGEYLQENPQERDSKDDRMTTDGDKEEPRLGDTFRDQATFRWHPVLQEIMDKLRPILPPNFESSMSLPFFVSFWQLSLNDLTLPTQSYNDEISRQKDQITTINADRSDASAAGNRKKEAEKKAVNEFLARLTEEMKASVSKHSHVRQRLDKEKQHWFTGFVGNHVPLIDSLLQDCFFPRMLMSPLDSQYAWRMLNFVHSSGAPGFNTRQFLEKLFQEKYFSNVLLHFTAREAENFGRFLNEVFKELGTWHASKSEYEKKAYGPRRNLPGFAQATDESGKPIEFLDYEEFRNRMYFWHANVCNAIKAALNVDEYVHIRNACIVLKALTRYFPAVNWMGSQIAGILQGISTAEGNKAGDTRRDDIWVLSTSVLGNLKARQKHWVLPQAFHIANHNQRGVSRGASSAPKSPQPDTSVASKQLNAEAAPFEPKSASLEPDVNILGSGKPDVEDGELEDVAMSGVETTEKDSEEATANNNASAVEAGETVLAGEGPNSTTTKPPKPDVAEMRARLKASAEARRQKSQTDAADNRTSTNGESDLPSQPDLSAANERAIASPAAVEPAMQSNKSITDAQTRPDLKREHSASNTSDRQPHALPNRPDVPPLHSRYQQRQPNSPAGSRIERADTRTRPNSDSQRSEPSQSRNNDRSTPSFGRQDNASNARYQDAGRPGNWEGRSTPSDFPRRSGPRETSDARPGGSRGERSEPSHGNARPDARSASSALQHASNVDPSINPDRAAMIDQGDNSAKGDAHRDASRGQRSRGHSPSRVDGRYEGGYVNRSDSRRDVRSDGPRSGPHDSHTSPRTEFATENAPNGPRNRPPSRQGQSSDASSRGTDLMQPPPPRGPHDRTHSRYGQDFAQRGPPQFRDDNYGRLNADSSLASPNSPPTPTSHGQRSVNNVLNRRASSGAAAKGNQPQSPAKERQPVSGPGTDQRNQASSAPTTPAAETQANDLSGVHPSRLEQLNTRSQPLQTDATNSNQQAGAPPSGPPSAPSPVPRNAPAGPTSSNERRRAEGTARRHLNDMQSTLSTGGPNTLASNNTRNATDQGTNIRGRAAAGRQQQSEESQALHSRTDEGRDASNAIERQPATSQEQSATETTERADRGFNSNRGEVQRNVREREEAASRPHRSSREHSRDDRPERERQSGRDRGERSDRTRDHGRSLRGNAAERNRERDRSPQRELRERGVERDRSDLHGPAHIRDHERNRRDGGPGYSRPERGPLTQQPSTSSGPPNSNGLRVGGRRGDGRETRELFGGPGGGGAGRGAPGDARKRGWSGEEGEGSAKRPRRGGYSH